MRIITLAAALTVALAATALAAATTSKVSLKRGAIGSYLVDSKGRTLYLFEKDTKGKSACSGSCAKAWPPVLVAKGKSKPTAGTGVKASLLGTVKRSDGTRQVTYKGHPLYLYAGDTKAGQTTGEGLNDAWYVVSASGAKIEDESGDDSGGGGGGGYGDGGY
ncbi:MAG TPA: hypothetical protein VHB30_09845 [Solirubrobacteraceae bacterium]|jgi:predicted lipoprotein with Yx(FWY)xxD motif|nr:hypothetical protein [Solirubrobacteraceae bacterium]